MGDASKSSTWSNVPYYFTNALEKKGHIVHRVNIRLEEKNILIRIISKMFRIVFSYWLKTQFTLDRTYFYQRGVQRVMKKALKEYPSSDCLISFDFSSSIAEFTNKKTVLFCDWDIEYKIYNLENRKPTHFESNAIKRQKKVLNEADFVITLFPNVYEIMNKRNSNVNLYYLGNAINAEKGIIDIESSIEDRYKKNNILFLGRGQYMSSILNLIEVVKTWNLTHQKQYNIQSVGIDQSKLPAENCLKCWDYLNKDNEEERNTYYQLIRKAKFLFNTEDDWVGASSVMEALFYGIPIIVNPNPDLKGVLGTSTDNTYKSRTLNSNDNYCHIEYGYYCKNNTEAIANVLNDISNLEYSEYYKMCKKCESKMSKNSWDEYIEKVLSIIS